MDVKGSTNRRALGLVNFVPALPYHFCLKLPAAFTQPGARLLVEPCMPHSNRTPPHEIADLFDFGTACGRIKFTSPDSLVIDPSQSGRILIAALDFRK